MPESSANLNIKSQRFNYASGIASFAPATTPTYIFVIPGSAFGSLVKVRKIGISATQTTGGIIDISLDKLSSALTGGVSLPGVKTGFDSTAPFSAISIKNYTSNPTGGGVLVGIVRRVKLMVFSAITSGPAQTEYIFDFTSPYSQAMILRGSAESLGITLLGTTLTGGSICIWAEWTEEYI